MTQNAYRDENNVPTMIASSSVDGKTPVRLYADPSTHRLLTDNIGGSITPANPVNSVQFNKGGEFGGDAGFTFQSVPGESVDSKFLYLGLENGQGAIIVSDATTTNYAGGSLVLQSGVGDGSGAGGNIQLLAQGGGHMGNGGTVSITAGSGGSVIGASGSVNITAGSAQGSDSDGGNVVITAGSSTGSGNTGSAIITVGNNSSYVGVNLDGGTSIKSLGGSPVFVTTTNVSAPIQVDFPNQSGIISTVTSGTSVPGSTPGSLGQIYVKTDTKKIYVSTGIASSADWTITN